MDLGDLKFSSVSAAANKDNSFSVEINGDGFGDTYSSMQASFNNMVDKLKKIDGLKVADTAVDMSRKTFTIKMDYKNSNSVN